MSDLATPKRKRGRHATNSKDEINESDYYVAHGLSALLLGAKYYSEAESHYARLPQEDIELVSEYVPMVSDIRWCGQLMPLLEHTGPNRSILLPTPQESAEALAFLHRQRAVYKRNLLRPERISLLDERLPRWRDGVEAGTVPQDWEKTWEEKFEQFAAFYTSSGGALPRKISSGPEEYRMYEWLGRQKRAYLKGTLAEERFNILDEQTPGWNDPPPDIWHARAEAVASHLQRNGKYPSYSSKDASEKSLSAWFKDQRRKFRRGELAPERSEELFRLMPSWDVVPTETEMREADMKIWEQRLLEFLAFMEARNRIPTTGATAASEEKFLGAWFDTQKTAFRNGTLQARRASMLNESLPGWASMVRPSGRTDLKRLD